MFAAFCFIAGVWRDLNPVSPPPRPEANSLPPALLVIVNGFLVLVAISALIGVCFGAQRLGGRCSH